VKAYKLWIGLLFLSACSQQVAVPQHRDPLFEKIYHLNQPAKPSAFFEQIDKAQVIFLGEHHDNQRHHQIQLEVLQHLVKQGKQPILAFEAFSQAQTSSLMNYGQGSKNSSAKALHRLIGGSKQWDVYRPLLSYAKKMNLELAGIDLDVDLKSRLTHKPVSQLTHLEVKGLPQVNPSSLAYQQVMHKRFTEGHCGWSSPELLKGLYRVWEFRNQAMAEAISTLVRPEKVVVVILGSGHLEFGQGTLSRFRHLRPEVQTFDLALMEVGLKPTKVEAYFYGSPQETEQFGPAYTWGWFTNRSSWVDPCERFKTQLKTHQSPAAP